MNKNKMLTVALKLIAVMKTQKTARGQQILDLRKEEAELTQELENLKKGDKK